MRESIGGTWLLGFVVLFIVLFSGYLAVSINYTKAFKVKNQIINLIEQNEGFRTSSFGNIASVSNDQLSSSDRTEDKIYYYIKDIGYATTSIESDKCSDYGTYYTGGYCVRRVCTANGVYYKVTSFIKFELPLIWTSFTIPIHGETKMIFYDNSDVRCG